MPSCLDLGAIRNRLFILAKAYTRKYGPLEGELLPDEYIDRAERAIQEMARPEMVQVFPSGRTDLATRDEFGVYGYTFRIEPQWFKVS